MSLLGGRWKSSAVGCLPPFHGCQAPTPAAAGGGDEWMSCPEGLCGPEEVDAYQVPPRTGADTLSVGALKTQQFVAWFGLFVLRGTVQFTDSSLLISWMFPLYRCRLWSSPWKCLCKGEDRRDPWASEGGLQLLSLCTGECGLECYVVG